MNYDKPYRKRFSAEMKETSIKEAFSKFIHDFNIDYNPFEYEIQEVWTKITGNLIKQMTRKVYVSQQTLYICVSSPTLRQELMLIKTDVLGKINSHFAEKYQQFKDTNILKNIIIKS
ncbi:MAG: DUF721 domain-containing protein [Bacteroidales bacterium]|jgi:hypothetical protein|nr:DUF721 domain-containing protein [Bacteroidales bacterium]